MPGVHLVFDCSFRSGGWSALSGCLPRVPVWVAACILESGEWRKLEQQKRTQKKKQKKGGYQIDRPVANPPGLDDIPITASSPTNPPLAYRDALHCTQVPTGGLQSLLSSQGVLASFSYTAARFDWLSLDNPPAYPISPSSHPQARPTVFAGFGTQDSNLLYDRLPTSPITSTHHSTSFFSVLLFLGFVRRLLFSSFTGCIAYLPRLSRLCPHRFLVRVRRRLPQIPHLLSLFPRMRPRRRHPAL